MPSYYRLWLVEGSGYPIVNKTGDTYKFDVYRACTPTVAFDGECGDFRIQVFQALPNQEHVLELITTGNGRVTVKHFDIFESPLRLVCARQ